MHHSKHTHNHVMYDIYVKKEEKKQLLSWNLQNCFFEYIKYKLTQHLCGYPYSKSKHKLHFPLQ